MIQIQLGSVDGTYLPNEEISGSLAWKDLPDSCERIEIRLIWYTSGKGEQDVGIAEVKTQSMPAQSGSTKFNFIAPHRPFSVSGKLVSIHWAVEAVTFPGLNSVKESLTISPTRSAVQLRAVSNDNDKSDA